MKSIGFYDQHAQSYIERTKSLDLGTLYPHFEKYLGEGSHVLDLGCGSGRDSLYFEGKGYQVTALDGSLEMVSHCRRILNGRVVHSSFEAYQTHEAYDGIWACASLLHVDRDQLAACVHKYIGYLKPRGVLFMSFKVYEEDFEFEGRSFTCFSEDAFTDFVNGLEGIKVERMALSKSIQDNELDWISAILIKED